MDAAAHGALANFYLRARRNDLALATVREALRLEPNGRDLHRTFTGAMAAKNWFFGLFWRWSLLMTRLSLRGQVAVILGQWLAMQGLRIAADKNPALSPYVDPIFYLSLVCCVYTWFAPGLLRRWIDRR